jgi:hypothetical protein
VELDAGGIRDEQSIRISCGINGVVTVQIKSRTSHMKIFTPSQHQPVTSLTNPEGIVTLRDVI